uniref:Uncharacterized protein n=1 Tax=Romanomermis culicivorax TaxID=13658 RepID=A0A915IUP5_ROMCU
MRSDIPDPDDEPKVWLGQVNEDITELEALNLMRKNTPAMYRPKIKWTERRIFARQLLGTGNRKNFKI